MANQYTHVENTYKLHDGIGTGTALNGGTFTFDWEDIDLIKPYRWSIDSKGYVRAYIRTNNGYKQMLMHHLLGFYYSDHINRNPADNCKSNLRECTPTENARNAKKRNNTSSKYKGVSEKKDGRKKKWYASIRINGKLKQLGYYYTQEEAAIAYNKAAIDEFREFAVLNIIN